MRIVASDLPVMKACCKTCPFKLDENGRMLDSEMADAVTSRTLFNSHQICHGTEGEGRKPNNRCKGSFDRNYEIYDRMGLSHLVK